MEVFRAFDARASRNRDRALPYVYIKAYGYTVAYTLVIICRLEYGLVR